MPLLAAERHSRVRTLLLQDGSVSVQQLADTFAVTRETIRRDLDQLEQEGALRRIHGGAVPAASASRTEEPLQARQAGRRRAEAPHRPCGNVLSSPSDGGSMLIDAGTTTEALAALLTDPLEKSASDSEQRRCLITNAVPIALMLSSSADVDVEMLGGSVRGITGAAVGVQTTAALRRRRADVVFLGTNGVDAGFGLSTPDTQEAAVKTELLAAGRQRVVLADSSKLGRSSLVQFAQLDDIDVLITDAPPLPFSLRRSARQKCLWWWPRDPHRHS
ncbi:DeoR/GlpR family DNA-binding transcription regulator [Nesterenkonia pannonica]|uniref:DeoR/GlpR family DNA-binding transcription regulator n=1 Tax=Nesterenkonia pannonica TaxID=1548602 RepID=UPI00216487FF|nr:DeoR/GlpR family DNA-binding transcription regulator [Nesterenkonia pannonica]